MSAKAIQAIEISKRFGSTQAVRTLNLDVEEGEFFSLLGPSGCGKTTLLRMIAGFESPSTGQLLVGGKDVSGVPPHKRPVNMVFQSYALFPHLTVADNVAFGLRSGAKVSNSEIKTRVSEALNLVRLGHLSERFPQQLSGGQQQRVALARAIINRPMVLLLDEPLSALDPQIREEMQSELARLQRELKMTFVMVTHDQGEALALSTRIAVFYNGNLEQVATPKEIYERPATPFVARFIGNTNLIDATAVTQQGEHHKVKLPNQQEVTIASGTVHSVMPGSKVFVSVKPQDLSLSPDGNDGGFEATVKHRSYLGSATEYLVETNFGTELRITKSTSPDEVFGPGQKVIVKVDWDACILLKGSEIAAQGSNDSPKIPEVTTATSATSSTPSKGD